MILIDSLIRSKLRENEYNYSESYVYYKGRYKILANVKCLKCKLTFEQRLDTHIAGSGCKKCALTRTSLEEFISKAKSIHNDLYNYDNINYINRTTKIGITCRGCKLLFWQTPHKHLLGQGCKKCGLARLSALYSFDLSKFIERATSIHGNRFDYSKSIYDGYDHKLTIICNKCKSEFTQTPDSHLHSNGCLHCSMVSVGDLYRSTTDDFISKARLIHGDRYDYDYVVYIRNSDKVTIKCCKCTKIFKQTPSSHLSGNGCGCQTASLGQIELYKFIANLATAEQNNRTIIAPKEIDIYIPKHKVGVEYNGIYYHSYDRPESSKERMYHSNKLESGISAGIKIIQIFEHEWNSKRSVICSIISNKLGCNTIKIDARKCKCVTNIDLSNWMDINHLQGHRQASVSYSLIYHNTIVAAMTFSRHQSHGWELIRLATALNTIVRGGASKMLKHFLCDHNPSSIITYADRRYSTGDVYLKLGFSEVGVTKPNYWYVKGQKVYSRQQFQKHKLSKLLPIFDNNLSEPENMFANGYRRLWDAGHTRFIYRGA